MGSEQLIYFVTVQVVFCRQNKLIRDCTSMLGDGGIETFRRGLPARSTQIHTTLEGDQKHVKDVAVLRFARGRRFESVVCPRHQECWHLDDRLRKNITPATTLAANPP